MRIRKLCINTNWNWIRIRMDLIQIKNAAVVHITRVSCCILSSRYWMRLSFSCTSSSSSLFSSTHLPIIQSVKYRIVDAPVLLLHQLQQLSVLLHAPANQSISQIRIGHWMHLSFSCTSSSSSLFSSTHLPISQSVKSRVSDPDPHCF
jgi:hypothetical protein